MREHQESAKDSSEEKPMIDHVCFTFEADGHPLNCQIIRLEKQCYVWIAAGPPKMGSLIAAMPTRMATMPSVTRLMPESGKDIDLSMAQRIAAKTGIPVVLAVELPPDGASVRQIAEARIIKEIMHGTS